MPLPDERPRQSVANLIGRFEQQTKRQSISGSPRSISVVSQNTGDSLKEEAKEKREWPPKPIPFNDKLPPSSWSRRNAPSTPSQSTSPAASDDVDLPPIALPVPEPISSSVSTPATPSPVAPKTQRQLSVGSITIDKAASPPALHIPSEISAPRLSAARPKTPPVKSPPKLSLGTSTPQPLKPQYTGQSATSTSSVRHTKPGLKATASTPSRAKVSTARPKTPSSTRPKTPSGLFAPTAASLAKARNAPPQLPTPTKKVTLSSSSADRLSKPTAASLARSTNAPASPARSLVKASPATRGAETTAIVKPRVGLAPARTMKQEREKKAPETKADPKMTAAGGVAAIATDQHYEDGRPEASELTERVEAVDFHDETRHIEVADNVLHDEPEELHAESEVVDEREEGLQEADTSSVEPDLSVDHEDLSAPPLREHDTGAMSNPHIPASDPGQGVPESMGEVKPRVQAGDDIEDLVNLLESGVSFPRPRSTSIASIPDEYVDEIPDEE